MSLAHRTKPNPKKIKYIKSTLITIQYYYARAEIAIGITTETDENEVVFIVSLDRAHHQRVRNYCYWPLCSG